MIKEEQTFDVCVIGAMAPEVDILLGTLEGVESETVGSHVFYKGYLGGKRVAVSRCGIGKVFAAICADAMIIRYSPRLVVNTGVGGALAPELRPMDVVVAERLVQHDMDTSALGDPKGLVSGINKVFFDTDPRAAEILRTAAENMGCKVKLGTVASGDLFVSTSEKKEEIAAEFGACCCEMEGAAIAQVAFVNNTPFAVVRAISDSADGTAEVDYPRFVSEAAKISAKMTLKLIEEF